MNHYFIIPGLGNSGPEHWQTYFESKLENCKRIEQFEWDEPDCESWIDTINYNLKNYDPGNVILIAHSLGCSTIAHWYKKYKTKIKGAMLVGPSDIESPVYTFKATGFAPIPLDKLGFNTLVVASTNDPWVSIERASYFASCWESQFIQIGDAGHINAVSGYGKWDQGLELLDLFN